MRFSNLRSYVRKWIEPTVIATVVVATFAVIIQQNIADQGQNIQEEMANQEDERAAVSAIQENQRAAVSRAVALYTDFVNSTAVKRLRILSHRIEYLIWQEKSWEQEEAPLLVFGHKDLPNHQDEIRQSLTALLQRIALMYDCGNFMEIFETGSTQNDPGEYVCDQETISILVGPLISEMYYTFRPVLYCDRFFHDRYFATDKNSPIGRWESLNKAYVERDFAARGIEDFIVFRTENERQMAIGKGEFKEASDHYFIMRSTIDRCNLYSVESVITDNLGSASKYDAGT